MKFTYIGVFKLLRTRDVNVVVFFIDGHLNTPTMNNVQVMTGAHGTSGCVDRAGVIEPAGAQVWGVALDVETGPPPAPNPDWRPIANKTGCAFAE